MLSENKESHTFVEMSFKFIKTTMLQTNLQMDKFFLGCGCDYLPPRRHRMIVFNDVG